MAVRCVFGASPPRILNGDSSRAGAGSLSRSRQGTSDGRAAADHQERWPQGDDVNGGFVERAINFGRRGLRGGLAALVSMLVLADPVRAETRIALVIGNSSYAVNRLPNPLHDADLIARTLRAVSFDVTLLIDADQTAMKRAMLEFSRQLRSSDSVGLFYYAGHGVQVDGENFLIPVGADIKSLEEVAINSVNLSEIMKTMERAEGRLNIAVLDHIILGQRTTARQQDYASLKELGLM